MYACRLRRAVARFVEVGIGGGPPEEETMRALERALVAQLGAAGSTDTLLAALLALVGASTRALGVEGSQQLHLALCMATRSESLSTRRGAMHGLSRLYAELRDGALVYVPEALPFVSELMEDGDSVVRNSAVALARQFDVWGHSEQ